MNIVDWLEAAAKDASVARSAVIVTSKDIRPDQIARSVPHTIVQLTLTALSDGAVLLTADGESDTVQSAFELALKHAQEKYLRQLGGE